jgi:hypothetical protein
MKHHPTRQGFLPREPESDLDVLDPWWTAVSGNGAGRGGTALYDVQT